MGDLARAQMRACATSDGNLLVSDRTTKQSVRVRIGSIQLIKCPVRM